MNTATRCLVVAASVIFITSLGPVARGQVEGPEAQEALKQYKAQLGAFIDAPGVEAAAAACLNLHTDDAVLMFPGRPVIRGRDAIRPFILEFCRQYQFQFPEWQTDELTVRGDLAIHRFHGVAILTPRAGGDATHRDSKYLDVLRRGPDGKWRVAVHMFNTNQ